MVLEKLGTHLLDGLVKLQNLSELLGHLSKALDNLLASLLLRSTIFTEREGKHNHGNELRSVGLGGCNTNLGTSIDVDTAVSEQRDRRTDHIDDTHGQGTPLQTVAESHQRIGSFTGLRNKDASIVTENRGLSVQEVGGQLNSDRNLSKLLKDTTNSHARVITSTTSNEDDSTATANG